MKESASRFAIISQVLSCLSASFQHLSQDLIEKSPANEYLQKTILIIFLHVLNMFQLLAINVLQSFP